MAIRGHSEVFKSVKADLEISYDEEIKEEDLLNTMASPHEVEAGRGLWKMPEVYSHYRCGRICRTVT